MVGVNVTVTQAFEVIAWMNDYTAQFSVDIISYLCHNISISILGNMEDTASLHNYVIVISVVCYSSVTPEHLELIHRH